MTVIKIIFIGVGDHEDIIGQGFHNANQEFFRYLKLTSLKEGNLFH